MANLLDHLSDVISVLESNGNLDFFENTYIKQLDSRFTDISVKLEYGGIISSGRGISEEPNLALKKAVYETIERACFARGDFRNTNGIAIAETAEQATENAINELIEREIFMRHWNQKLPFNLFENDETVSLRKYFNREYTDKINIEFYQSQISINKKHLYLCMISGLNYETRFGLYLGYGYKNDCRTSILHSFFEAINTFSFDYENSFLNENLSLEEFLKKTRHTFKDHGLLAKNCDYALKIIKTYFSNIFDFTGQDFDLEPKDFSTRKIDMILNLPLTCIRVENRNFLPFEVGPSEDEFLPHPID